MSASRIDDLTDVAWLAVSSVVVIVGIENILTTMEHLIYANNQQIPRNVRLTHGALMVLVGICSATISLPDDYVRAIVQSVGVGVGFALRELLSEALSGAQLAYNINQTFKVYDNVEAMVHNTKTPQITIIREETMSFIANVTIDNEEIIHNVRLPWSYLQKRLIVPNTTALPIKDQQLNWELPEKESHVRQRRTGGINLNLWRQVEQK